MNRPRKRGAMVVLAVLAAAGITAAVPALGASAAGSTGPQASAAKISKKQWRRIATRYLRGEWNAGAGSPVATTIAFCDDGTYGFRVVKQNARGPSDTTFDGSWFVQSAGRSSFRASYTIEHFKSVYIDGSPGPDSYPGSPAVLSARPQGKNQASFDGVTFTRGPGTCSSVIDLL